MRDMAGTKCGNESGTRIISGALWWSSPTVSPEWLGWSLVHLSPLILGQYDLGGGIQLMQVQPWKWELNGWGTILQCGCVKEIEAEESLWKVWRIGEDFYHHHGWLMWIPLNKGWKCDQRLHLCLVRAAKDGHHPKLLLTYPICDEDSHWHNLFTPHFLARVSGEVDSGLAPHFGGDQLGEETLLYHPEMEGTLTKEFINGCPLIQREGLDQIRVCQKLIIVVCNLQLGWLGKAL